MSYRYIGLLLVIVLDAKAYEIKRSGSPTWKSLTDLSGSLPVKHWCRNLYIPYDRYANTKERQQGALRKKRSLHAQRDGTVWIGNFLEHICSLGSNRESIPVVNPINNNDFPLILNSPNICASNGPVQLLLLISSSSSNFVHRKLIRSLWANKNNWYGVTIAYVFLIGLDAESDSWLNQVYNEQVEKHDIILQAFEESSQNKSFKLMLGLQWSIVFCPQAKWLYFLDDSVFVNPFNVIRLLQPISEAMRRRAIIGSVWYEPFGSDARKLWFGYRTKRRTPESPHYPTFVGTTGFIVGSELAYALYRAMQFTPMRSHSDWFFATVMQSLHVVPMHCKHMYAHDRHPREHEEYQQAIQFPVTDPSARFLWLWRILFRR